MIVSTMVLIPGEIMNSKFELQSFFIYYIDMSGDKDKIVRGVYYDQDTQWIRFN